MDPVSLARERSLVSGVEPPAPFRQSSWRVGRAKPAARLDYHYDHAGHGSTVSWDAGSLIVDGRRTLIFSGEFHYWRFPDASEWESVLLGYKAAGLNAIRIYFHWGYHSPRPGVYCFDGNRDVDALLSLCERLELLVLAAPGPYICAETSGGGFPFWLLEDRSVRVRHMAATGVLRYDEAFMAACLQWYDALLPILASHQITRGAAKGAGGVRGCVALFQVDNELFERKVIPLGLHRHMAALSAAARARGITVPFFHDDGLLWGSWLGSASPAKHSVDMYAFNLYVVFAPGSVWGGRPTERRFADWSGPAFAKAVDGIEASFRGLGRGAAGMPIFVPEMQVGWFARWGLAQGFDELYGFYGESFCALLLASCVAQGVSLASLYTFCGGTNWGALPDPDVYTSYDYAAPIREFRHPSGKLHALRTGVVQVVRALEADFATSAPVPTTAPLHAELLDARSGARAVDESGLSLLAKQRESEAGVQLILLRSLATRAAQPAARLLALRCAGVEVRAELGARSAFFALGHVGAGFPYMLLCGAPLLSHGPYAAAGAGGAGAGSGSDEYVWILRCAPRSSAAFRGHLRVLSEAALPERGEAAAPGPFESGAPASCATFEGACARVQCGKAAVRSARAASGAPGAVVVEPVSWLMLSRPCVVRLALQTGAPGAGAEAESGRSALVVCLGEEDARSLATFHAHATPGGGPERFGAAWGTTSAVFTDGGAMLRATATGAQRLTVLPPLPAGKPPAGLARPRWAEPARATPWLGGGGLSSLFAAGAPAPPAPRASLALACLAELPVGSPTPASASLERPLSGWEACAFDWAALSWEPIDLSSRLQRDSLYHGFNGGLSFYRATFELSDAAARGNVRLRLNVRHRAAVWCNGRYAGSATVYAAATLRAGAPFGPDLTPLGSKTLSLRGLVRGSGSPNELTIVVHSFGQSRSPVILDDSRNPRGLLSAQLKGGARRMAWAIAGLDCKGLSNAFGTDGVPPCAVRGAFAPLPPPPTTQAAADGALKPGRLPPPPEPSGFALSPADGIVHARATFASAEPGEPAVPPSGRLRTPLRLVIEGGCWAYVSLNGTPVCRYHGDLGPQRSFFLPDGLLRPAGQLNTLTFTGHAPAPTVVRLRVRPYDLELRSANLLEPEAGGLPLRTTSVTLRL